MIEMEMPRPLYEASIGSIGTQAVEQVGFFLADFDDDRDAFITRDWQQLFTDDFEYQSAVHVTLTDHARAKVIQWAAASRACLIEVHTHDFEPAAFSSSDRTGLLPWVPHVRWRLANRPYGAIVVTASSFDALAWTDATGLPRQVAALILDDGTTIAATRRTLEFAGTDWRDDDDR